MNIAVYVRVSTQRQAQAQTIEQQLDSLQKYHESQGWPWNEENIFRDDGYSGAKLRRPGLDRLREQVGRASFDKVIITAPDRLARNYVHQMLLIEEFERGGCQVEFVDRPMSHDPHDQLLLQIRGAVSEYERSLIAERMRRGRRQKYLAGGLLPWTRAPYGYRVDPARPRDPTGVRLEATEAAIVAELFSTYLQEGKSLKAETQRLTKLSVSSPAGKSRWNQATVRGILTNPVYTGTVYIGRSRPTEARGRHSALVPIGRGRGGHVQTTQEEWTAITQVPAIVTQEQFDLVQAKLAHNQQFARRNNTAYPYLLRAMVSCGTCRLGCIGRSSRGGYAYYVCVGRSHGTISHREEKCSARSIPVEQLDELVWQDVCEMLMHPEQIATALYRAQGGQWLPQELQARRENLRKARVSLEQQMERLTDAYLANVLQLEEYKRRRQALEQRLSVIAEQKRQLEANVGRHDQLAGMVQSIEAFCQRVQQGISEATFEQKRQLIELLIDRVVVTEEEVEIRYAIPTSSKGETIRFCHLRLDYFKRLVLRLVPKGSDKLADYFVGAETQRTFEKVVQFLQTHYQLQPGSRLPGVPFNPTNGRAHLFPARPYLFQMNMRHFTDWAVTACMRFLCHGLVFQARDGQTVSLKAHSLRHVFATHTHHVEQLPLDVVAVILHQKNLQVTAYYAAPQWEQVVAATDLLLDRFATHLGSVEEAMVRSPAELKFQYESAREQVGTLTRVIGGECTCHALCPVSFACTGCVYKIPDPARRDEVLEQKQWALIRLEQVKKRRMGPEEVKMQALIQRCNIELEEMNLIEQYRNYVSSKLPLLAASEGTDRTSSSLAFLDKLLIANHHSFREQVFAFGLSMEPVSFPIAFHTAAYPLLAEPDLQSAP